MEPMNDSQAGRPRLTMVSITSLRDLHRMIVFTMAVSLASLTILVWRLV